MQFTIATIAVFAAVALAAPASVERKIPLCFSGRPLCCATDVLNVANLNCEAPPITPLSINEFINTCAREGQQAKCCLIPILGQALICSDVNPTAG